jgi:cytoskeletal protein CcmA (bactofilin family)
MAMSVFCTHCRKRLILEDYVIKTFQGIREYATCGDVTVEKSGRITATIRASTLLIKGEVKGDVSVRERLEVTSTGSLTGNIVAPAILVGAGARISGHCRIHPQVKTDPLPTTKLRPPPVPNVAGEQARAVGSEESAAKKGAPKVIKPIRTTRRTGGRSKAKK